MPHIFISYAKKDTRQLAFALDDALNALDGVTSWVDRSMKAGESWEIQIQTEIDRCDLMVVFYSPDINRHKNGEKPSYMLKEIAYAQHSAGKPIIPVMIQPTTPPLALTTDHYIDYVGNGMTLEMLVEALCYEMNIIPKPRTDAPPPQKRIETPPSQ
ncbi:MAG: toll/interleukin-1 receptor domain-containing protein, partial [Anaerolineae bacterium]|nr:toll/interleukin-1 receptor domain-containing protein [Anaerolineae bacterium]